MTRAIISSLVCLICAAALGSGCSSASPSAEPRFAPPPLAPPAAGVDFTLPRIGGGQVRLSSLRGHPVLLTLFTTWCLRCQVEAPWIVRLHQRYEPQGLQVLGVALDKKLKVSLIEAYVEFVGFPFDVVLATPDDLELVGAVGKTRQVPRTVLLDAQGQLVADYQGPLDLDALRRDLEKVLPPSPGDQEQPAPPAPVKGTPPSTSRGSDGG